MTFEVSIDDFDMIEFNQLAGLFGSHFQLGDKLLTKAYTEWLYAKNPYGLAKMVKAVDLDRWVGFMALIPVRLVRRDTRLVAYYAVNALVHPQYQGKHIFSRLIEAAKGFVKSENAVLMGHPNDLALKPWQRSRMHFHEPLRPSLVTPTLRAKGTKARNVEAVEQLAPVLPALNSQALKAARWHLALTDKYLAWRFFEHPANRYRVQLIEVDGAPAGFLVSRKVRPGISLLVDQFMLDCYVADGLGCLPWLTVSFMPESSARELSGSLWRLPLKKRIPFFLTYFQQPFTDHDVMDLGLSASDF